MITVDGIKAYTYKEIYPIANKALIDEITNKADNEKHCLAFDVKTKRYCSQLINKWLTLNGYYKHRKMIKGKSQIYYFKVNDNKGFVFSK